MTLIFIGIPLILIWLAYNFLRRKTTEKTSLLITAFLFLFLAYFLYADFYPTDNFYLNDYRKNTSFQLPDSAELISKRGSNSIYNFGDYNISYAIKLTPSDFELTYAKLLERDFKENETYLETSENDLLLSQFPEARIANILAKDYGFRNYEVLFMNDGRTIICNSNKW